MLMEKNKIVFSNSGGATRFISLMEGNRSLIQDYNIIPTDICGVSSGAIVSFISAIAIKKPILFEQSINIGLNLKISDMFDLSPINAKGNLRILSIFWRILNGENSFGLQNIKNFFETTITETDFIDFQNDIQSPNVWVMSVRPRDMKRGFWNLKDKNINYKKAIKIISASTHIPVYSQPIQIDDLDATDLWVDGGIRNHNPSPKFIDLFGNEIKELYTFYTRRDSVTTKNDLDWDKNMLTVLIRIMNGMVNEISKRDSQYEKLKSCELGFDLKQFFYPGDILESMYDVNKDNLKSLYLEAIEITKNIMSIKF
jgi:predicted patatin/cPLA2 family phospholipase